MRWVHRGYDESAYGAIVATAYVPCGEIEIRNQVTAYYYSCGGVFISGNHSNLDNCKAAAESWYRKQLTKALRRVER